ncbi:Uu.00g075570.m01.CDS01 [Anthostomella pinea]|uniref:Uu.00g075570.m01.CDS01 n=1 Tax=Anthostomella pinea TaxID=933095 RepID=A0AAI8VVN4_9PEZI|nr:Uu.00g075570.m01.CDS01 [Anthostomella pinea]
MSHPDSGTSGSHNSQPRGPPLGFKDTKVEENTFKCVICGYERSTANLNPTKKNVCDWCCWGWDGDNDIPLEDAPANCYGLLHDKCPTLIQQQIFTTSKTFCGNCLKLLDPQPSDAWTGYNVATGSGHRGSVPGFSTPVTPEFEHGALGGAAASSTSLSPAAPGRKLVDAGIFHKEAMLCLPE